VVKGEQLIRQWLKEDFDRLWRIPVRAEQRRERKAEAAKAGAAPSVTDKHEQTDHRPIVPQRNGDAPSPDAAQNTHQRARSGRWYFEPNSVETEQAHKLLREQLSSGPKPGSQIEALAAAAEISESALVAAADVLRVRTQRGQWWLPG
jgi:hypothetical protein